MFSFCFWDWRSAEGGGVGERVCEKEMMEEKKSFLSSLWFTNRGDRLDLQMRAASHPFCLFVSSNFHFTPLLSPTIQLFLHSLPSHIDLCKETHGYKVPRSHELKKYIRIIVLTASVHTPPLLPFISHVWVCMEVRQLWFCSEHPSWLCRCGAVSYFPQPVSTNCSSQQRSPLHCSRRSRLKPSVWSSLAIY